MAAFHEHTHTLEDGTVITHTHGHIHEGENSTPHEHHVGEHDHVHSHDGHTHTHGTHTHTHTNTKAVLNRMARIIGHMSSVKKMVEDGRDCSEVLIQLSAIDASVKSLSRVILKEHISTCLVDAVTSGDEAELEELNRAIDKFLK